jgi:hypothetical protein
MPKPRKVTERGDQDLSPFKLDLTGKLIKSSDPSRLVLEDERTTIVDNFSELKNNRYTDTGVRGIRGMTPLNTTATTNKKIRNVHQFVKSQPAENHMLVQAYDASTENPVVYKNDTAIPGTGDFNGTALHTDADGAGRGRFENGPLGRLVYCNGVETMVWGGDESRLSNFTVYNPDGSFKYDYTEKVQNTLSDAANVASLFQTPAQIDTNTVVLYHLEDAASGAGDVTDSSTAGDHDGTYVGNTDRSTAQVKFGTYSAIFDGAGDWITIPDHVDLDLSGGTWTIDMWIYADDLETEAGLYSQGGDGGAADDDDYMAITITTGGAVKFSVFAAAAEVIGTAGLQTADGVVSVDTWHHIAVVSTPGASNTDYFIFVDGVQKGFINDSENPANNYSTAAFVGARHRGNTTDFPFTGHIDEFRLSDSARWTSDFDVPAVAYGTDAIVYARVGNILPISAIKFSVSTPNGTAGTASVDYWNGSAWTAVSNLVDTTVDDATSTKPLGLRATDGSMTFDSTASVAKQSIIDGVMGYWYRVRITKADAATRISNITVTEPFQALQDFWDGEPRVANSVQLFQGSVFKDYTFNVLEDEYINTIDSTFMEVDALTTSEYLTIGTFERSQGFDVKVIPTKGNDTSVAIEVEYWSGAAWVSVGAISDGTNQNGKSLAASGTITWNALAENVEFRTEVNKSDTLYFYKLSWSGTLGADVQVYYTSAIPVQRQISNYKFALHAQDRLMLFSDQADRKNTMLPSARSSVNGFNGKDSGDPVAFGDDTEVTAAVEISTKLTTGIISDILVGKINSMYLLIGSSPEDWTVVRLSSEIGVVAPLTLKTSPVGLEIAPLQGRQVAIWQSENGIMMYDSNSVFPISDTISNFFDRTKTESINLSKIADSTSFWDISNGYYEYHWCFASGSSTTLDRELVFDLRRQKWWEVDRGTGKALMCGTSVNDTSGAHYSYGCTDDGFMERIENGTDFDGNNIVYTMEFGDIMPANNPMYNTVLRHLRMSAIAKTTAADTTVTHYADMNDTGNTVTLSTIKSGYRVANPVKSIGSHKFPEAGFHRLKFVTTTNDETIGFEPLWISGFFKNVGINVKP